MTIIAAFPENDTEYRDISIKEVGKNSVTFEDGFSIYIPESIGFQVEPGMSARQYGKGLGHPVRGLYIDGKKVWYRDVEEQGRYQHEQIYGKDAADILNRWDAGDSVFSVEMGGLGPGYEQCIQIMAFEVLRYCLNAEFEQADFEEDRWDKHTRETIEQGVLYGEVCKNLGPSGAQWGAAVHLGTQFYLRGPHCLDSVPDDRKIQVSKTFPSL